jgi:hypothetical protein
VSPTKEESTLDRYIDHIVNLIGIDGVGLGFDFFEFIYRQWPESRQKALAAKFTTPHFIPDLRNHAHARKLTRRLIERGFSDVQIQKILFRNPGPTDNCFCGECRFMKMNTLEKAYDALLNMEPEITLPEPVRKRAEAPILRMLELSR